MAGFASGIASEPASDSTLCSQVSNPSCPTPEPDRLVYSVPRIAELVFGDPVRHGMHPGVLHLDRTGVGQRDRGRRRPCLAVPRMARSGDPAQV